MPVTIKIDGIDYPDQAPEVQNYIHKLEGNVATLTADKATMKTALDAKDAEIAGHKATIAAKEDQISKLPAQIQLAAKSRSDMIAAVTPLLPKETKFDSLTDDQIRLAVAVKAFPDKKESLEKLDAAGLKAYFDAGMSVLTSSRFDAAAAANRQKVGGDPSNPEVKGDAQTEYESKILKNDQHKGNRDTFLR